jgi:hypothetical protein
MEIENNNDNINNEIIISKNKLYYNNFHNKNKEKIHYKNECLICGGSYSYFNKSTHLKSSKCQKVKTLRNL